jgi:hypothetical protein
MKRIFFLSVILTILIFACNKVAIKAPDDFTVSTTKTTYKVGDTVVFNFTGNPDNLLFYSGEAGHDYANANAVSAAGGNPEMQFLSNVQFGAAVNDLSVFASTDFTGQYDTAGVRMAHWTDITSRLALGTSATNVSSGIVNLNDLKDTGNTMYIAFRYLAVLPAVNKQKQWTISSFQFRTRYPDGRVYTNAATNADASFGVVDIEGDSARWSASTTLFHVGLSAGYPGDDDWVVSKAFYLNRVNPDAGIVVKSIIQPPLSNYTWTYAASGTYKAVFVAQNSDVHTAKRVVKEIDITITP